MNKTVFRRASRRWHKRAGLFSAFVVLLLSITGICLNHTAELGLGGKSVRSATLLAFYGQTPPEIHTQKLILNNTEYYLSDAGGEVFLDTRPLTHCAQELVGAVDTGQFWVLACDTELFLYTYELELIESMDVGLGLPVPVTRIQICGVNVCVHSEAESYAIELDGLHVSRVRSLISPPVFVSTPIIIQNEILDQYTGSVITWERVVLDVHAGRFLGSVGPWLMDFVALLFIFLAVSGIYIWWFSAKQRVPHRKRR